MQPVEAVFLWGAVFLYAFDALFFIAGNSFNKEKLNEWGLKIFYAAFISLTLSITIRWSVTGHPPLMSRYENAILFSWTVSFGLILLIRRWREGAKSCFFIVPFILLMLGYGIMTNPALEELSPPFRSGWLIIHVLFACMAYGAYSLAAGFSASYLMGFGNGEIFDERSARLIVFGFVSDAVMIIAGAFWASNLWGRYWGWDPIEVWSLISWLVYGAYLHLRKLHGWRGKKTAWFAVVALIFVLISFWGITFMEKSIHMLSNL